MPEMSEQSIGIVIPEGIRFSDLKLERNQKTGKVSFDWVPIERICEASGVNVDVFKNGPENNVSELIVAWYSKHRKDGGEADPVQEMLLAEVMAEGVSVSMANPGAGRVH